MEVLQKTEEGEGVRKKGKRNEMERDKVETQDRGEKEEQSRQRQSKSERERERRQRDEVDLGAQKDQTNRVQCQMLLSKKMNCKETLRQVFYPSEAPPPLL